MSLNSQVKKSPRSVKIFMWALLIGAVVFCAWSGTHSTLTEAADTSSTRTVTVNATVSPDIEIYITDTEINLAVSSPGSPVIDTNDIEVWTNSESGYTLWQSHNQNLTHTVNGSVIIDPDLDGTVDAPVTYSHNGLGFSLNGTPVEGLWNDGANFSTFYDSATESNNFTDYSSTNTIINVIYQLDVETTQAAGEYQNEVYWYAVSNDD